MKKLLLCSGSALLLLCGCTGTRVADGTYSEEEEAWIRTLKKSYPGYKAPGTVTPAYSNATLDRTSAKIAKPAKSAAELKQELPAAEDPDEDAEEVVAVEERENMTADNAGPAKVEAEAVKPAADAAKPAADAAKPAADAAKPAADAAKPAADAAKPAADAAKPADDAAKPAAVKAEPLEPTSSTVYEVRSGDTLGKISLKAYGTARHADLLFKANSDLLKNPNQLKPGMKLLIPKL